MGASSDRCYDDQYLALVQQKARGCDLLELSNDTAGDALRMGLGFRHGVTPFC